MFTVNYIIAIAFIVLGFVIGFGKQYWLIAGYNTSSQKEKAKVKIEALAKFMMVVFVLMAVIISAGTFISQHFDIPWLSQWIILIAVAPGVLILLIQGNSKKYIDK